MALNSTSQNIKSHIMSLNGGTVFTPKELLDFASRDLIDKTLSRLVHQGFIRRAARGIYYYPKKHRVLGYISPPLDDIAIAISNNLGQKLQISGAEAVHLLGLTTQVPAKRVYYTDGTTRKIKVGNQSLQFKHVCHKIMAGAGEKAGIVLQAIRYLGKHSINDHIVAKIAKQLDDHDRKELKKITSFAPDWSRPYLNRIISHEYN